MLHSAHLTSHVSLMTALGVDVTALILWMWKLRHTVVKLYTNQS
jgi:hypothetical protein